MQTNHLHTVRNINDKYFVTQEVYNKITLNSSNITLVEHKKY